MTGAVAKGYASKTIRRFGRLTVTRPSTGVAQSLYCMAVRCEVPDSDSQDEGSYDVTDAQPHKFVFEGGVDVKANDLVTWSGSTWRLKKPQPTVMFSVQVKQTAVGLLER